MLIIFLLSLLSMSEVNAKQINQRLLMDATSFVIEQEGFIGRAYKDGFIKGKRNYSIGYGSASYDVYGHKKIKINDKITKQKARELVIERVKYIDDVLDDNPFYRNCTHNQKIALIDLAYNVGVNGMLFDNKVKKTKFNIEFSRLIRLIAVYNELRDSYAQHPRNDMVLNSLQEEITNEFLSFNKAFKYKNKRKIVKGLVSRRVREVEKFFIV